MEKTRLPNSQTIHFAGEKRESFKKTRIILLVFSVLIMLVSCGQNTQNSTDLTKKELQPFQFRITWPAYSARGETIQQIVDSYNVQATGSVVTTVGGNEDISEIQTLLNSNQATIVVLPYRFVKYFGELGLLKDLTDSFVHEESFFYPEIWEMGTLDGKTYGVPWIGHSMCLLYNQSILNAAGVDPASIRSLDALRLAMERVEEGTAARGIGLVGAASNDVSWMVNQFVYGFGSRLVSEDGKEVVLNNARARAAIEFYRDVLGAHAQPSWTEDTGLEVMAHFRNQEVAFEIQGIWGVTDIQKNGSPFDVGIISLDEIGLYSEVGPMMMALPAGMSAEASREAEAFMHYMISIQAQEQIMNGEYSPEHDRRYPFRTPIRIDMADSSVMKSYPGYEKFIEGFHRPSVDVPVPKWQIIKDELYAAGLHQVMVKEMTIDEFLNMIEIEGNKILNTH